MTTTDPTFAAPSPAQPRSGAPARAGTRDPRLDFFRGLAMFIILIAHTPGNAWAIWIPARFGFSDATEIFVFCSGMASAIAFGTTFARKGWLVGLGRTLFRIWQVYWAHIGLFFFIAMLVAVFDGLGEFGKSYIGGLNLWPFFNDPIPQIIGLFSLSYVPNYFDILPMYLVILALMPGFIGLARISLPLAFGASVALWVATNLGLLPLPAEPWSDRQWFFNPFGWQLIFFTGFSLMSGWLPAPPVSRFLVWASIAFLILTMPLSSPHGYAFVKSLSGPAADWVRGVARGLDWGRDKTEFGVLRYLHFLALAYLAWIAAGARGARLRPSGSDGLAAAWRWLVTVTTKVGQQSLAIFVFSMVYARILGFLLDRLGASPAHILAMNLIGFATLIGVAYGVAWFKAAPWRKRAH